MDAEQAIIELVKQIPKGKVTTYGILGEKAGIRGSARMVGWILNKQKASSEVPCHRVVNRFGLLSGKNHFPTPTYMEELLKAEGINFVNENQVDIKKHLWKFND